MTQPRFRTLVSSVPLVAFLMVLPAAQSSRPLASSATPASALATLDKWPAGPRLAGREMIAKYGSPQEVTAERMIWHHASPFKRVLLTKQELPHDFPITHMDYLEHTIDYNVPPDKTDEVHAFDASITIYRVAGELSARCDLESNNVLTLNLAHDIATGKKSVEQGRKEFTEAVVNRTLGAPPASTVALEFQPGKPGSAADLERTTVEGTPQRAPMDGRGSVGTSGRSAGRDAEILAMIVQLDEDEIHAAMTAEVKKVTGPTAAFAKVLHQEHGKNIQSTQQVGLSIGVTPLETAAVNSLHMRHAAELATIVMFEGNTFERAFVRLMVAGHRQALRMLDGFMSAAQHDQVKEHVTITRRHVADHLKRAERLLTK